MANSEHVAILKQGVDVWNKWRMRNFDDRVDLSGACLDKMDLEEVDFYEANLKEASFIEAQLNKAEFSLANLCGANLHGADLWMANFIGANLSKADLGWTDLDGAIFNEADLSEADLSGAILDSVSFVGTNLEKAKIVDCSIYGISVWNVRLDGASQANLHISSTKENSISVDNLEVAQFIYLLLNNQKVRQVIDTITSKVVIILGRFSSERKQVLEAFREELRHHNYSPVVFNFEEHSSESFIETARTLANMAHFVLVDLTDLDDVIREIATSLIPRCIVPFQPFLLGNYQYDHSLVRDLQQRYRWVLSPHRYKDISSLLASFQEQIIQPAENKVIELKQKKPFKVCS